MSDETEKLIQRHIKLQTFLLILGSDKKGKMNEPEKETQFLSHQSWKYIVDQVDVYLFVKEIKHPQLLVTDQFIKASPMSFFWPQNKKIRYM